MYREQDIDTSVETSVSNALHTMDSELFMIVGALRCYVR